MPRTSHIDYAPILACYPLRFSSGPSQPINSFKAEAIGGLFSVALFRVSPRMAVSHHPARWSPDFPPPSPLMFLLISTHFTATPEIPLPSPIL